MQGRVLDGQRAGAVVADEEDRAAALHGVVVLDHAAGQLSGDDPGLARKIDEARTLQLKLLELFDTMLYTADFPEGFRAAAELRGIKFGAGRQPQTDEQRGNLRKLSSQLQEILKKLEISPAK